jgi:chromate transporter
LHQATTAQEETRARVSLLSIFWVFLKIGAFTFGGGYAMLPIIQREIVERNQWTDFKTFSTFLVITQSVPGTLALNCSIQIGLHLRGLPGALLATLGVILPPFAIILLIAAFFLPVYQGNVYVQAVFYGIRPAIVALIASAAVSLGRQLLSGRASIVLAAALFLIALLCNLHPIAVMLAGGLAGLVLFRKEAP